MILDSERRQIFTLGRFQDSQFPSRLEMKVRIGKVYPIHRTSGNNNHAD